MLTKSQVIKYINNNPKEVLSWFKTGQKYLALDTEKWHLDLKIEDILELAHPIEGLRKTHKKQRYD